MQNNSSELCFHHILSPIECIFIKYSLEYDERSARMESSPPVQYVGGAADFLKRILFHHSYRIPVDIVLVFRLILLTAHIEFTFSQNPDNLMTWTNGHSGVAEPAQNRILDRDYLVWHRVLVHSLAAPSMQAQLTIRGPAF
jgi:hypothetical protein